MTSQANSKVLYVSSEGRSRIGADALAAAGFEIEFAQAQSAIERAADASSTALILVDIDAQAPELIQAIVGMRRPDCAWVPVIACCVTREDIDAAIAAGADDFLLASDASTVNSRVTVLLRQKSRSDKLDGILNCTFDGIVTIDENGSINTFNRSASRMFGFEAREVIGRNVTMLMQASERALHDGHLRRYLDSGTGNVIGKGREVVGVRKNGETFPLFLQVTLVRSGRETLFVGVLKDLSLEEQADSLRHELMHDLVTGIGNRRMVETVLQKWIARRHGNPDVSFAVVFIDLDRFKAINDTFGHQAGDAVLKAVAGRLSHRVSRGDVVGRIAGDEFVILLDDIHRREDAEAIARRVLDHLSVPVRHGAHEIGVTGSAGVAMFPLDATTVEGLLRRADRSMYDAKKRRRGTVGQADPNLSAGR